ncbi:hypothetical protein C8R43DRAFT_587617 [Mycena crocata]|nr:hypothetical protein C8R43DRAFT_587617 [Mycena crocata]
MAMYWSDQDTSSETSSAGSSTPPFPSSALPSSSFRKRTTARMQHGEANDVLQSVLRHRKTWKTQRGGETVWPMELEAALLEGLERYQPDDSRETRMLGRFPRRNRFISDYIFEKTGKRRSAKQVGSRLQQLRESCTDEKLLELLSPFRKPAYRESSISSDSALESPLSPVVGQGLFAGSSTVRQTVIYIDIVPEGMSDAAGYTRKSSPWSDSGDVIRASDHPRRLQSINPTVSFTSRSPIIAHSRFTVYSEELILHAETVPLVLSMEEAPRVTGFVYSTSLVPKYWKTILDSPDPTRFTIFQDVVREDTSALVFSATYKFSYPRPSASHFPPQQIASPSHNSQADNLSYPHLLNSSRQFPSTPNDAQANILFPAPHDGLAVPKPRYPMQDPPVWPSLSHPQENPAMQRYPSAGSGATPMYFPYEVSNYVS